MPEPTVLHEGTLGPYAAKKLAAIAETRARLDAQEQDVLATVAEAHGFVLDGVRVKFDYDPQAGTYKVLGAPEEEGAASIGGETARGEDTPPEE